MFDFGGTDVRRGEVNPVVVHKVEGEISGDG